MNQLYILQKVLEASVEKRGEVPLSNAHLLNIVRMARRVERNRAENHEKMLEEIYAEVVDEDRKWGSD